MNIWLIQTGEPLPTDDSVKKMRTALLAEKLVEKGHSVLWWTSAFDHTQKKWIFSKEGEIEKSPGYKFFALKGTGYKKNISLMRFIDHRMVAWKFFRKASEIPKPDVIIASLPPHDLAYQAVRYATKNNIPVLVDVRDPWPDIFLENLSAVWKKIIKIFLWNDFNLVKKTMQNSTGLIAVTNNFMNWALTYSGRQMNSNDKVLSLGYKKSQTINSALINEKFLDLDKKLNNKFIVFFVGTFSKSYHNPLILLEVAERLKENKNIHFVISGDGELFDEINHASEKIPNVSLTGWLNRDEIEFWLKRSKIGVCPATKSVNLPTNKAYAYLSASLPVISAFEGELKDIIEKQNTGFYYPPNDVNKLVSCILKLYEDKVLYKTMSENAKRIFHELFDADKIYEEYARHIETVAYSLIVQKSIT